MLVVLQNDSGDDNDVYAVLGNVDLGIIKQLIVEAYDLYVVQKRSFEEIAILWNIDWGGDIDSLAELVYRYAFKYHGATAVDVEVLKVREKWAGDGPLYSEE